MRGAALPGAMIAGPARRVLAIGSRECQAGVEIWAGAGPVKQTVLSGQELNALVRQIADGEETGR